MSELSVVDSSAWLEYFADSSQARHFEQVLLDPGKLVVPVITIYEVFKKILRERDEHIALEVVSQMYGGAVVDLSLTLDAAHYQLPLADSIIYATALKFKATLWTQDKHFKDLPNVRYFAKRRARGS